MTDKKIYQCCYTNRTQNTGGGVRSGWEAVAVSEDIPQAARKRCGQLQSANSTIQGNITDENGEILNLLEICGDSQFVYVMRTQYGLQDRVGRSNMFSHAYILHWEDVLADPNAFLRLTDRSNFRTDEEAALQLLQHPAREPDAARDYTIEDAMKGAGLSAETYPTLIQHVYSRLLDRRIREPLYIQCGGEEQMHALLFCIYYGLPHYLRKQLHTASAAGDWTEDKHVIFSRLADQKKLYLNLQTGKATALTARTSKIIERYGFIDYAARHTEDPAYFTRLSEEAARLGDPAASNEQILKIAHRRLMNPDADISQYSDSELDELLSDALRSQSYGSIQMIDYIRQMLDKVLKDRRPLSEACQNDLDKWETAVALTKEQTGERDYLAKEYDTQAETERQKIETDVEAKYTGLLETRQQEIAAEENKALASNIQSMEDSLKRNLENQIQEEYEAKEKELTEKKREEVKKSKPLITKYAIDKYAREKYGIKYEDIEKDLNSASEQAKKSAQEKKDKILRDIPEVIESNYNLFKNVSEGRLKEELSEERKKIEKKVMAAQDAQKSKYADELKKKAEDRTNSRCEGAKKELDQKKEHELARRCNELEKNLDARKPENLRELETKEKLAQAIKECRTHYITGLSPEEAVQRLSRMSQANLEKYTLILSERADGRKLLADYYENLLQAQPHSWEQLCNVLAASGCQGSRPQKLTAQVEGIAWDLYEQSLKPVDGRISLDYDQYTEVIQMLSLSEKETGLRETRAKETFWEWISLESFTQEDAPLYNKMALESKRCGMFSSFYSIWSMITEIPLVKEGNSPNSAEDLDIEKFLQAVQDFFSRFHSVLRPAEQAVAQEMLKEKVRAKYSGKDAFLADWIPVMMEIDSERLYQKVSAVRAAIRGSRYDKLVSAYKDLFKSKPKPTDELSKAIRKVIQLYCDKWDNTGELVPLDVWLIAADQPDRPFDIFDKRSPAILQYDSYNVIAVSRLMQDMNYIRAAESYVRDRGQESKIVKKWLNEVKQGGDKKPDGGLRRFFK